MDHIQYNRIVGTAFASLVLLTALTDYPAPTKFYKLPTGSGYSWEREKSGTYSSVLDLTENLDAQAILDFANEILQKSKDIKPEFNEIINKKFWDLLA
jgi:hypothetical protein